MTWSRKVLAVAALSALLGIGVIGCGGDGEPPTPTDGGVVRPDTGPPVVLRCSAADDPDMDLISAEDEGAGDADSDGTPNSGDTDSDGDGFLDRDEAGDADCTTPPRDTDLDGTPDFLDTDANGDGIPDADQRTTDTDGDGIPDALDADLDGDGISNAVERGDGAEPADTDRDGTPDLRDLDSDGDTILDAQEGAIDADGDGTANFRDLDTDGDGIDDAIEAGDGDTATPPRTCGAEINPLTGDVEGDGLADFVDADSDNDGAGDGEEVEVGSDPCNTDSDGDGFPDVVEVAYAGLNCTTGTEPECGCATSVACGIPSDDYFIVLPYRGPVERRDLEFGTTIRVADVFFITDTTGSMGGTLSNVQDTVAAPGGLIDRISETIPDVWIGGGQHDDYPFGGYGSSGLDQPFILAIGATDVDLNDDGVPDNTGPVQSAFRGIMLHGGNDGPESQTEALYQIVTGEGGTWMGPGPTYTMPNYAGRCLDTGWGGACFREAALPIIVHFTDICSHNGPPDEDPSCDAYTGITPAPVLWTDMVAAMNRRGAKYIGVNASGGFGGSSTCSTVVGPSGYSPCWFELRTARETGSVDLDGNELVYDLPNGADRAVFTDTIVNAIETVATRVPLDVDTALRDDPSDPYGVDARQFIVRRQPACNTPGVTECWVPPPGITAAEAVAVYDTSTFFGVVPGTRVTFTIDFQNLFWPGGATAQLFVAFIDVRGGGSSVLDTRQVYIVVPANDMGGLG